MTASGDKVVASGISTIEGYTTGAPICKLVQQASQTALVSAADTVLTFGTSSEEIDTHNFHDESTNNTRVTPSTAGYYRLMVTGTYQFSTTITAAHCFVRKNGTVVERTGNTKPNGTNNINTTAGVLYTVLTANGSTDYFEAGVNFTGTANQATNATAGSQSRFLVEFMRPL